MPYRDSDGMWMWYLKGTKIFYSIITPIVFHIWLFLRWPLATDTMSLLFPPTDSFYSTMKCENDSFSREKEYSNAFHNWSYVWHWWLTRLRWLKLHFGDTSGSVQWSKWVRFIREKDSFIFCSFDGNFFWIFFFKFSLDF